MVEPTYFQVEYEINPYMKDQRVDRDKAMDQWKRLKDIYLSLGFHVDVLPAVEGLPDMVFSANTFLSLDNGICILSKMAYSEREPEVLHTKEFLLSQGREIVQCPQRFEGMGDAIWNYFSKKLYVGIGPRTSQEAVNFIAGYYKDLTPLELIDPYFYHLDTCFSVFNKDTAVVVKEAFSDESYQLLLKDFSHLIEIPRESALNSFVCNAHCPDGVHIIGHLGMKDMLGHLDGFKFIETATSEYLKSGGSVFCMKNQYF